MEKWSFLSEKKGDFPSWFGEIARQLFQKVELQAGGKSHRLTEIEFYYYSFEHPDVFTHCDEFQKENAIWYFHRMGGNYKGGSFKGLDLTFGGEGIFGGIIVRSIETPEGQMIIGPCLCVNYLLEQTGYSSVAELDEAIAGRKIWDEGSPLFLRLSSVSEERAVFSSPRIGLTLKKEHLAEKMFPYIMSRYRFLVRPSEISKGKIYLALALYREGKEVEEIQQITGSPRRSIENYIEQFEEGRQEDCSAYVGKNLSSGDLARLYGAWSRQF